MTRQLILFLACILVLSCALVLSPSANAKIYEFTINSGEYEIIELTDGQQEIHMHGFGQLLTPKAPKLPSKIFSIGIPPEATVRSVKIIPIKKIHLPGKYHIIPAEIPYPTSSNAQEIYTANGDAVYSSDDPFPKSRGKFLRKGAYRKYDYVDVRFTPFEYHPQSGNLFLFTQAKVMIDYEPAAKLSHKKQKAIKERKPEVKARGRQYIINYDDIAPVYEIEAASSQTLTTADTSESYDYVIITTYDMRISGALDSLVDWETCKGKSVHVVDLLDIENEIGSHPSWSTELLVRTFLREKLYDWGIEKVLIVASHAAIPMRVCHTERDFFTGIVDYPTDYYYAELSEHDSDSWDADHDDIYGEEGEDDIDFTAEVDVGRIPFSSEDIVEDVCEQIIAYDHSTETPYKKSVLFPTAFFDEWTDNAKLAEVMYDDFLGPAAWERTRLYEYGPTYFSEHDRDAGLNNHNLLDYWSTGTYGYVCWAAHGSSTHIAYDHTDTGSKTLLNTGDTSELSSDYPSVVFAHSCNTATPETTSLAHTLLSDGIVAAYYGAVRPSAYMPFWDSVDDGWDSTFAYWLTRKIYAGSLSLGRGFYDSLRLMYTDYGWDNEWYAMFVHTFYGNPAMCISRIWELPALVPTTPVGWDAPIVVRNTGDAAVDVCNDSLELFGNTDATYLNFAYKNVGGSTTPDHYSSFYRDGKLFDDLWRSYFSLSDILPDTIGISQNIGSVSVPGGRHTVSYHIDSGNKVYENDDSDNIFGRQFVWRPMPLPVNSPITRPAPPTKEAVGIPLGTGWSHNNDGFSFDVQGLGIKGIPEWSAVAVLPGGYLSDYNLRLWDRGDYQGSHQGFGPGYIEYSVSAIDRCDFVLVNGHNALAGEYYAGVINFNEGTDPFRIEAATSNEIYAWPATEWNGPYLLEEQNVIDVYECYLTPGTWTFELEQTNPIGGVCDLAMALYGPDQAHYSKHGHITGTMADENGHGQPEQFVVDIIEEGRHALAVWKADSDDYTHQTEYRIGYGQAAIRVYWPNGGDTLAIGANDAPIIWHSYGDVGDELTVAISHDGGTGWSKINPAAPDTGYCDWVVMGPASDLCLIQIASNTYPAISDTSDALFSIIDPSITLTGPNGGQTYRTGDTMTVKWESQDVSGDFRVELSRDNGASWTEIGMTAENIFDWKVAGPDSDQCLVRVATTSYPLVDDTSDAVFAIITQTLDILHPNGGETCFIGEIETITWSSQNIPDGFNVELSRDGGGTWTLLGTASQSPYEWTVSAPTAAQCRIRVTSQSDPGLTDMSNVDFTIAERSITLTSPNGGEVFYAGEPGTITWESQNTTGHVAIAISRDAGSTWMEISAAIPDSGEYIWTPEAPGASTCRIRVAATDYPAVDDMNDADFTLAVRGITLLYPNGGEQFQVGEPVTVLWTSAYITGDVMIELSKDSGEKWFVIRPATPDTGTFDWRAFPKSDTCLMRITSVDFPGVHDITDSVYQVTRPPKNK